MSWWSERGVWYGKNKRPERQSTNKAQQAIQAQQAIRVQHGRQQTLLQSCLPHTEPPHAPRRPLVPAYRTRGPAYPRPSPSLSLSLSLVKALTTWHQTSTHSPPRLPAARHKNQSRPTPTHLSSPSPTDRRHHYILSQILPPPSSWRPRRRCRLPRGGGVQLVDNRRR